MLIMSTAISLPLLFGVYSFTTTRVECLPLFLYALVIAIIAYFATDKSIPTVKEVVKKAGISASDLNKQGTSAGEKEIPEGMGITPAIIFVFANIVIMIVSEYVFNVNLFIQHLSGILSICVCALLGFSDDVINLRWITKIILPVIAMIPFLLSSHTFANGAVTYIDMVYFIQQSLVPIFCINSIEIYSGINGLEVGQSIIIGCGIILHNIIEVATHNSDSHLLSLMIAVSFILCSLALLKYNKFPSMIFAGNAYCYFAGMTFAVLGFLGNFSKTLFIFFIPQILNVILSLPQLVGLIPIARHRLPAIDNDSKKLIGQSQHWNLLNAFLRIVGPQNEETACNYLMMFQVVCCGVGLGARYIWA